MAACSPILFYDLGRTVAELHVATQVSKRKYVASIVVDMCASMNFCLTLFAEGKVPNDNLTALLQVS